MSRPGTARGASGERATPAPPDALLEVRRVSKAFGGVRALHDASLLLRPGSVLALVGENGAGKSTLLNIISGVLAPDRGTVALDGRPVRPGRAHQALERGIGTVHQELTLFPHLRVWENVFAGHEDARRLRRTLRPAGMVARTRELLGQLDVELDPETPVQQLTLAEQQLVEIAKALSWDPRLLILDEATSALDGHHVRCLFRLVRALTERGTAVVFVSHRLQEVLEICDEAVVLKDGEVAGRFETLEGVTEDQLVERMVGRSLEAVFPERPEGREQRPALEVRELAGGGVRDVSLDVRPGEIVGLGGLQGHGQQDLLRILFGVEHRRAGTVRLGDRELTASTPAQAIAQGVAYVPPDRKTEGLLMGHPVEHNLTLVLLARKLTGFAGVLRRRREEEAVADLRRRMRVVQRQWRQPVDSLSGGNQQKVVLGKWLDTDYALLLLDEPTRGVDVGTKSEVYRLLRGLAEQGKAILLASTDGLELLGLCDRIYVLYEGRVQRELRGEQLTEYHLTEATLGVTGDEAGEAPR